MPKELRSQPGFVDIGSLQPGLGQRVLTLRGREDHGAGGLQRFRSLVMLLGWGWDGDVSKFFFGLKFGYLRYLLFFDS